MIVALIIALVGIGFILGVLATDIFVARPLRTGLKVISLFGKRNPGYNSHRQAENILNYRPVFEGMRVWESMMPYKQLTKKPLNPIKSPWNKESDL